MGWHPTPFRAVSRRQRGPQCASLHQVPAVFREGGRKPGRTDWRAVLESRNRVGQYCKPHRLHPAPFQPEVSASGFSQGERIKEGYTRMLKRFLWAGLVGLLAVAVVGTSAATTGKGAASSARAQVLRMSIGAEPPSLDPGLATDTTSADLLFNIMDPLVRLGNPPTLKALPGAAASWKVRGATVTLNLRRNVRWTNGQPVTAQDYVWSWLRTISPELGADYAYQFYGIKGAEAYNGCKSNCGALRAKVGLKALSAYKLRIQLTSPQPWFIQQLSHTSFLPVNKGAVTRYGKKWTEPGNIVTNGPFKLSAWRHDASVTLVKNTRWRGAKSVKLQQIVHP